jgi:hypothetical protein
MNATRMLQSAAGAALCAILLACGGGGSAASPFIAVAQSSSQSPAFEELWEPRTPESAVAGYVWDVPLVATPDGSDPQTGWVNMIRGKWGTLAGLEGVLGVGPNRSWSVDHGRLHFHGDADGFALISRLTFDRSRPIAIETDIQVDAGVDGAFAGLALIAGEGDYREIAIRRNGGVNYIKRNTPLRETLLGVAVPGPNILRLEYDPASGFRFLLNGVLVGTESINHEGASFAHDPSVGLYFVGNPGIPGSFVEGSVGPVRVWTEQPKGTP